MVLADTSPSLTEPSSAKAHKPHGTGDSMLLRIALHPALHVALLLGLVTYCFVRAMKGYFLADDFGQVLYVAKAYGGEYERIWRNWTGHLMEIPSMAIYRPWFFMSLLIDYAIWKGNAFGYLLSNFLCYSAGVTLLYALVRKLTSDWTRWRSCAAAFFGTALFAVNPLHCESVAWISGRTDEMCCMFFLASLVLALNGQRGADGTWRRPLVMTTLSILCFAFAMLSKEMAIGTAVLIAAIAFLWPEKFGKSTSETPLVSRVIFALRVSSPWIIATIIYFVVRFLALGTVTGGYTGGLGAGQAAQAIQRWLDPDVIYRLLFPLSSYIYPPHTIYRTLLMLGYAAIAGIAALRLFTGELSKRWLGFFAILTFTTVVPLYSLWGLGMFLQGARYYFFLTIPMSLFLSIVVFQPSGRTNSLLSGPLSSRISIVAAAALLLLVATFARITYATNSLWMHAGREVRDFKTACEELARNTPPGETAVVLSAPNDHGGAHMILNAPTFFMMLQPPFTSTVYSEKFASFEPPVYGQFDTINADRFKAVFAAPSTSSVSRWSTTAQKLVPVELPSGAASSKPINLGIATNTDPNWQAYTDGHGRMSSSNGIARLTNPIAGDGLFFPQLSANPLNYDFLQFDIKYDESPVEPTLKVRWNIDKTAGSDTNTAAILQMDGKTQPEFKTVRVRLSHCLHWYTNGLIKNLAIELFPSAQVAIRNVSLVPSSAVSPVLSPTSSTSPYGVYPMPPGSIAIAGTSSPGATKVQIQVSKPDYFFENNVEDPAIGQTFLKPLDTRNITVEELKLPQHGHFQIRSRWLNDKDAPTGEWSEPLTIQF
jgi:hypothetical protein